MTRPALVITGASGFVGRHLIELLQEHYRVFGIARRSQARCGLAEHPNVSWFQADIGEAPQIADAFEQIARLGGAQTIVHLAAHYDFAGDESDEYWRTNVEGLRNVLNLSVAHKIKRFLFSSSVAACRFPEPGRALTESSPPHGEHIYARTKRAGEEMLGEYAPYLHAVIMRFAALFSDWCEYPPLYMFLQTWLSNVWNRRILGGHGLSAIPYLHVNDVVLFIDAILDQFDTLGQREVLIASPDGCTNHLDLFEAATLSHSGTRGSPIFMPRPLCGPGMLARDLLGRVTGNRPFERPWMARYIDQELRIDSSHTRARLGWAPRTRLEIVRRIPFLIENLKTEPVEWHRRNREAMKAVTIPANLRIHWMLQAHEDEIIKEYHELLTTERGRQRFAKYQDFSAAEHAWNHRLVLRQLMHAVRTRERGIFMAYCRDLAEQRLAQGFQSNELCGALEALNLVCFRVLRRAPGSHAMRRDIYDFVTTTLKAGCDQAQEVFELHEAAQRRHAHTAGQRV